MCNMSHSHVRCDSVICATWLIRMCNTGLGVEIQAKGRNASATHCNTLQHTATHCNTLQRIATHLQHTIQADTRNAIALIHTSSIHLRGPSLKLQVYDIYIWHVHILRIHIWHIYIRIHILANIYIYIYTHEHVYIYRYTRHSLSHLNLPLIGKLKVVLSSQKLGKSVSFQTASGNGIAGGIGYS